MVNLSGRETAMVSGGTRNNAADPKLRYCIRCGRELTEESDKNLEKKYKGRLCSDCVFAIKIYSRPEF